LAEQRRNEPKLLLSAFAKAASLVGLTLEEQSAVLGRDTDQIDRMAHFVGIVGLAAQAFPGEHGAEGWLRRPNTNDLFRGKSPLAFILENDQNLSQTFGHLRAVVRVW